MKVLILSMGIRGDIEPYIGLAQAFIEENIPVTIATNKNIDTKHARYRNAMPDSYHNVETQSPIWL